MLPSWGKYYMGLKANYNNKITYSKLWTRKVFVKDGSTDKYVIFNATIFWPIFV